MTWYASQIYAQPTAREALEAQPALANALFDLDGLLVAREVYAPDTDVFRWCRGAAESWESLRSTFDAPILSLATLPSASNGKVFYDSKWGGIHPPGHFLRLLKQISHDTGSVVSYYFHASGAERSADQEFAWVFGTEPDCLYVAHVPEAYRVTRHTADSVEEVPRSDKRPLTVLMCVLRHFGLDLPSSDFAPHTRDFDWERRRL